MLSSNTRCWVLFPRLVTSVVQLLIDYWHVSTNSRCPTMKRSRCKPIEFNYRSLCEHSINVIRRFRFFYKQPHCANHESSAYVSDIIAQVSVFRPAILFLQPHKHTIYMWVCVCVCVHEALRRHLWRQRFAAAAAAADGGDDADDERLSYRHRVIKLLIGWVT